MSCEAVDGKIPNLLLTIVCHYCVNYKFVFTSASLLWDVQKRGYSNSLPNSSYLHVTETAKSTSVAMR
jgi:hypothetical protein